jgi:hypothetical protein
MSKKQESTALATVEQQDTDLAVASGYDAADVRGKEGIEQGDLLLSRIAIAQKMSPEVDADNEAKFIDGLKVGDLFDTVTREVYGPGPIKFTIVRPVDKSAKVLDKEGNVLEWDVDFNDPRCEFTQGEGQTRNPPVATRFYNFLVLLNDSPDFPVVLSMKRTQVPIAKNLMTLMARRPGPIFAGSYTVRTVTQEGPNGPFKNFAINPAGAAPDTVRALAEGWYTKLQTAAYRVEDGPETKSPEEPPF